MLIGSYRRRARLVAMRSALRAQIQAACPRSRDRSDGQIDYYYYYYYHYYYYCYYYYGY